MPLESPNTVQVTFRLDPRFIETTPFLNDWQDIGITEVKFIRRINGQTAQTEVTASLVGTKYQATVNLLPNESYDVRARVTNANGSVLSLAWETFDTSDTTVYDNVEVLAVLTEALTPLSDAELVIENPLGADWTSRATTENGRAWIQRIPRGTYDYTLTKAGYDPVTGSVNTASNSGDMGYIEMSLTP